MFLLIAANFPPPIPIEISELIRSSAETNGRLDITTDRIFSTIREQATEYTPSPVGLTPTIDRFIKSFMLPPLPFEIAQT